MRMLQLRLAFPFPVFRPPVGGVLVAAGVHKFQKFVVGDGKDVDRETGHFHALQVEFIVPAKTVGRSAQLPKRRYSCGNRHLAGAGSRTGIGYCDVIRKLVLHGKIMEKIGERFGMHQAMLDRDVEQGPSKIAAVAEDDRSFSRSSSCSRTPRLYFSTSAMAGQSEASSVGSPPSDGIDSERKKPIQDSSIGSRPSAGPSKFQSKASRWPR